MNKQIPVFIERDPDVIMSECTAKLQELLGRELQPAQVEQLILQSIVFREVLLVNRFNAGMSQMLYQFSHAPVLDYIAALVAVERLPAANAGCVVRFELVAGHGVVLIPEGTRVATSDGGVIFRTVEDITVEAALNTVEVEAAADVEGKGGNGHAPAAVNKILDPLAFVSTVANIDTTGGGSDVETDEQLRERIKLAPSQYSSAGSRSSYKFYATSANALIIDVSISSPIPGTVVIVPLTEATETPEQVIADVYAACSAEDRRPLTDTVIASAPTREDYAIEVNVELYENTDATSAKATISAALEAFANDKRQRLGRDVIKSNIAQVCRIEGVYDVAVVAPVDNIVIDDIEFANCTNIIVTITGFNRG